MIHLLDELKKGFADLFWPAHCLGCHRPLEESGFCEECREQFKRRSGPRCVCCDTHIPSEAEPLHSCAHCREDPPVFERAFGLFDDDSPIGRTIRSGKYSGSIESLHALAFEVASAVPDELFDDPPVAVLPVALHPFRIQLRGFSLPLILADAVARRLQKPLLRHALFRIKNTKSQAELNAKGRQKNLIGMFEARAVQDLDLLLVDDVMTTGATFRAASEALLKAGAARVRCLAAASVRV